VGLDEFLEVVDPEVGEGDGSLVGADVIDGQTAKSIAECAYPSAGGVCGSASSGGAALYSGTRA